MDKKSDNYFLIWGWYAVAALVLDVAGFYFSAFAGAALLGVTLAGAAALAFSGKSALAENLRKKYGKASVVLETLGRGDTLASLLVLPLIAQAFADSMGWRVGGADAGYAKFAAVGICFIWSAALTLGVIRFIRRKK